VFWDLSRKKCNTLFDIWPFNFWRVGYILVCKKKASNLKKKKPYLSGHYFFSIKSEAFFLANKYIPHPPKVKWSNIEYSITFFFREVRDKNKESSIYTQNSWIVDICLILLHLTKCGYCSKKSLKIPKG
jgi:hypothetical protein